MFTRLFWMMFGLLALVAVLHSIGLSKHYYWSIWWYDIVMHGLGGAWAALVLLWVSRWSKFTFNSSLLVVLAGALIIGSGWEIYELTFGLTFTTARNYYSDTTLDLIMDLVGGSAIYFSVRQ